MKFIHSCSLVIGLSAVSLSGCGVWQAAREDAPPPPVLRGVRVLETPEDIRKGSARPAANPASVSLARAAVVNAAPNTNAPGAANTANSAKAAADAAAKDPNAEAKANAAAKGLFTPYFPTPATSTPPKVWTNTPQYDFPWINGAEPTRVNEEVVFGAGSSTYGRFYAKVSFGDQVMAVVNEPPPVKPEPPKQSSFAKAFKKAFGMSEPTVAPESTARPEAPRITAGTIQCTGVLCLDIVRDMLAADAKAKGWEMIFTRRVSLHQSYQFLRAEQVVGIEVDSTGGKQLSIEYSVMPPQMR